MGLHTHKWASDSQHKLAPASNKPIRMSNICNHRSTVRTTAYNSNPYPAPKRAADTFAPVRLVYIPVQASAAPVSAVRAPALVVGTVPVPVAQARVPVPVAGEAGMVQERVRVEAAAFSAADRVFSLRFQYL